MIIFDQVEMECMGTKDRYLFNCRRWLATDEDDHSIVREIPADGKLIKKPLPRESNRLLEYTL